MHKNHVQDWPDSDLVRSYAALAARRSVSKQLESEGSSDDLMFAVLRILEQGSMP